jgi:tetratricopeptide (TPR) repeat protein
VLRFVLIAMTWLSFLPTVHGKSLQETKEERNAIHHLNTDEFLTARKLAESELEKTENVSVWANYVLGRVHSEGEGNLARGLYLIRQAKIVLLDQHGSPPVGLLAQRWHRKLLMREQFVLGLLDRREEQLSILDAFDEYYPGKRDVFRLWPLLKLGRFDEARGIAKANITSEEPYIRERAYNGLMAIEEEAGNREASYTWGLRGLTDTRKASCIIATNLALGARRTFRFRKTIEHDQTALKTTDRSCPTSPHAQLAAMYLVFGEFQQCLSSLKALREAPQSADMKVQNEMVIRARFVELLLALGAFEQAEIRAKQIIDAPDRAGMVSTAAETIELTNQILAWSVLNARLEQLRERISARKTFDAVDDTTAKYKLIGTRRSVARQAIRLASLKGNFIKVLRPYLTDLMPWFGGDIIHIFGTGTVKKAVAEAGDVERELNDTARLFLKVYLGETAWVEGREKAAIEMGNDLLKRLPKATKLLRMRIRSWLADALRKQGAFNEASRHFHQVLNFYPTALRHLQIKLPVKMILSGKRSTEIRDRLANSPRLDILEDAVFAVRINGADDHISICLEGKKNYGCGRIKDADLEEADDVIAAAIDAFHDTAFAPKIELTQSDVSSLDGRSTRMGARQAIDSLLGKKPKKKQKRDRR